jgi:hypothetical protein
VGVGRGGDDELKGTSSACPSRERDSRTWELGVGVVMVGRRSGQDDGWREVKLLWSVDISRFEGNSNYLELKSKSSCVDCGVLKELSAAFHRFERYPIVAGAGWDRENALSKLSEAWKSTGGFEGVIVGNDASILLLFACLVFSRAFVANSISSLTSTS